jgi:2-hydroxy-3-oxopropionate reductase
MSAGRRNVGLIGLGQMGGAMCRTLLAGGWRVAAWDVSPAASAAAAAAGAQVVARAADLGDLTDLIITSLPNAQAVRDVTLGIAGIVHGHRGGTTVIDTSTTLPEEARALARDLAAHQIGFMDAPVSGGVSGAASGKLAVMAGGTVDDFERARPVLECIGTTVVHCGPVGSGQVAKACNQLVVISTHVAVAEALTLAEVSGLDPWQVRDVLLAGYAASPILQIQGPRMLRHDFTPGGVARFHLKDIEAIGALAEAGGIAVSGFRAAAELMGRLIANGGGGLDDSAVITVIEPATRRREPADHPSKPPTD